MAKGVHGESAQAKEWTLVCTVCKEKFLGTHAQWWNSHREQNPTRPTCSRQCASILQRHDLIKTRKCPECGVTFEFAPKYSKVSTAGDDAILKANGTKYCSQTCWSAANSCMMKLNKHAKRT